MQVQHVQVRHRVALRAVLYNGNGNALRTVQQNNVFSALLYYAARVGSAGRAYGYG